MADQAFVIYRMVVQAVGRHSRDRPAATTSRTTSRPSPRRSRPRTRLVFLANPNNPTGTIFRRDGVGGVPAAPCRRHVLVVADDAYAEYVEDTDYPDSIASAARATCRSSRCARSRSSTASPGCASATRSRPRAVIEVLGRIRQPFNVNALALVGALAALDDDEHVAPHARRQPRGHGALTEAFRAARRRVGAERGELRPGRVGARRRVYEALLRRGVIVRPMDVYGFPRAPARDGRARRRRTTASSRRSRRRSARATP